MFFYPIAVVVVVTLMVIIIIIAFDVILKENYRRGRDVKFKSLVDTVHFPA